MGRLIDADALKVTKIVERKRKLFADGRARKVNDWTDVVLLEDIEDAPTIDAVEVVRCGKCKNAIPRQEDDFDGMPPYYCPFVSDYVRDNDFCCHGERRSNETD